MSTTVSVSSRALALRSEEASVALRVAGALGFALLTALGAQVRIYLWEVPFSLQTLAVYGSGLFLGMRYGALSQVLYLAAGLVWPVFAGAALGFEAVFGATGGYLLAFPLSAALVGALTERWNSLGGHALALVLGAALVFAIGLPWYHVVAGHASWDVTLARGFWPFLIGDVLKVAFAALAFTLLRRAR